MDPMEIFGQRFGPVMDLRRAVGTTKNKKNLCWKIPIFGSMFPRFVFIPARL